VVVALALPSSQKTILNRFFRQSATHPYSFIKFVVIALALPSSQKTILNRFFGRVPQTHTIFVNLF